MNPQRTVTVALLLAILIPVFLSLVAGCQDNPPAPEFNNPFDPESPTGGDPLNIRAYYGGGVVTVIWDHLDGFDIATYDVDRSLGDQSSWEPLVFDLPTAPPSWVDSTAVPNVVHYYKVQAKTADGSFTISSYIVAAEVETPPFVAPSPPGTGRPSRYLDLKIVTGQGDSVRVAGTTDFANADLYLAPAAGETLQVTWDLGLQNANDDTMYVYVESFGSGYTSERADLQLLVDFAPPFTVEGMSEAGTVADRDVVLLIPDDGVETMRFASTEGELDTATPVPGAPTYPYQLADVIASQSVYGRFDGDFGFTSDVGLVVVPDDLATATFSLDPDSKITSIPEVRVFSDAVALHMAYSDSADMTNAAIVPYADTLLVPVTPTPGMRKLYIQYENAWTNSAVLVDTFEFVLVPLSIAFHTPAPDEILAGGETFTVTGRAVVADGGDLDAVKLDLGDGQGFSVFATTEEYWTYDWGVPRYRADKPLVLRARAYSGTDSVTTTVSVTVTQLAVAITEPAPDEVLDPGSSVTIAGTATPPLDGAVDSVTVAVDGVFQTVTGITNWSVDTWSTPDVTVPTPLTITAAAWAGGDSVQTTVNVTVEPSSP